MDSRPVRPSPESTVRPFRPAMRPQNPTNPAGQFSQRPGFRPSAAPRPVMNQTQSQVRPSSNTIQPQRPGFNSMHFAAPRPQLAAFSNGVPRPPNQQFQNVQPMRPMQQGQPVPNTQPAQPNQQLPPQLQPPGNPGVGLSQPFSGMTLSPPGGKSRAKRVYSGVPNTSGMSDMPGLPPVANAELQPQQPILSQQQPVQPQLQPYQHHNAAPTHPPNGLYQSQPNHIQQNPNMYGQNIGMNPSFANNSIRNTYQTQPQFVPQTNQSQQGMQPQTYGQANPQKPKIDPDQIPSPVVEREKDQDAYNNVAFVTSSRTLPPLASTKFRSIDEGNCSPRFIRSTLYSIPISSDLLNSSRIPLGLVVQPMADLGDDETAIPVVDFGKEGPLRCASCRGYVNPNFQFVSGGRLFICNLCSFSNEVPSHYISNLDMNGNRLDVSQRPELNLGSVEFSVGDMYCGRPAKPVSYLFVVDVSWNAIKSGMVATFTSSLRHFLYGRNQPLVPGCRVGIITYDRIVHCYNLNPLLDDFQQLVVPDIEESYVPIEDGLLVDPIASKPLIESLLDKIPQLFVDGRSPESCVGAALQIAYNALKKVGGKISLMHCNLPNRGPGILQNRDDPAAIGTDKERKLFEPQEYFWSKLGQGCSIGGVSVDTYLFPTGYVDVATIGIVSALSGGGLHLYSGFDGNKDGIKFANDLQRNLARTFGFDGILRVRCSNGIKIDEYLGNFFMKNATDVELAGADSLSSIVCTLAHDGKLEERQEVHVQAAFLYTTAEGQRRVRVHNMAFQCTSQLAVIFRNISLETVSTVLCRYMIQQGMSKHLGQVRNDLVKKCIEVLVSYRANVAAPSSSGQLILPETIKLFPVFVLSMLKARAFRGGRIASSDFRVYSMRLLNSMGVEELMGYLYPSIYDATSILEHIGERNENGLIMYPVIRASIEKIKSDGIYIAENGRHLFLWIGKDVEQTILKEIFDVHDLASIPTTIPTINTPRNIQIRAAIDYLRRIRPRFMHLTIVKQGLDSHHETRFLNLLIEDANFENSSYVDFLVSTHRSIQAELSKLK